MGHLMETKIYRADGAPPNPAAIQAAAEVIRGGGLAAFPTETVYGLGADALRPEAAKKIYEAKGRPSDNPLIVHIADFSDMEKIARELPEAAKKLSDAFWPGPLTMVVKKSALVPYETTGGLETVAVRMPGHPAALALIRESGRLIAAPSANTSGRPSPTLAAHVAEDLGGKIPVILDGGEVGIGIESTIVDLTETPPMILRPGFVTEGMLEEVIGPVKMDPGTLASDSAIRPKAPGMRYRHYAPYAELMVVDGNREQVIAKMNALTRKMQAEGKKVGILASDETLPRYGGDVRKSLGAGDDGEEIARRLYRVFREFDASGVDVIYSESVPAAGIGRAVRNRLLKAAGQRVIDAGETSGGSECV